MTTAKTPAKTARPDSGFQLPDPPEREPDEMTRFNHLSGNGNAYLLAEHLGNRETTLVGGEHYIAPEPTGDLTGLRYPDLFVAFGVDPLAYYRANCYVISEQVKPPDLVLEIASRRTGRNDVVEKREEYAALGIPEYWRFDETGQHHGTGLAGDRLVDGRYVPVGIEELAGGVLQGYSRVLDLNLRWEEGRLVWHDPATGQPIATLEEERRGRVQAEARADSEHASRIQAEARNRELKEELRRLRGGSE